MWFYCSFAASFSLASWYCFHLIRKMKLPVFQAVHLEPIQCNLLRIVWDWHFCVLMCICIILVSDSISVCCYHLPVPYSYEYLATICHHLCAVLLVIICFLWTSRVLILIIEKNEPVLMGFLCPEAVNEIHVCFPSLPLPPSLTSTCWYMMWYHALLLQKAQTALGKGRGWALLVKAGQWTVYYKASDWYVRYSHHYAKYLLFMLTLWNSFPYRNKSNIHYFKTTFIFLQSSHCLPPGSPSHGSTHPQSPRGCPPWCLLPSLLTRCHLKSLEG